MRFPDGEKVLVRYQYELVVELTKWLRLQKLLSDGELPIRRYTDNRLRGTEKDQLLVVPSRDRHRLNAAKQAADLFVETHFQGPVKAEIMRTIIERAGQKPSEFAIRL